MNPENPFDATVRDNLLAEAGRRNLPADLIVVRGENLQANFKTRFLQAQPDRLLLEAPTSNGHQITLQAGQFVEVYFKVSHERFGFDSRVIGYCRLDMDGQDVEAVSIAWPHFLEARQRRNYCRVSVATLPPIEARLAPICMDDRKSNPITGRLCNLSAGGVAVLVDRQRWPFTSDRQFRLSFCLPEDVAEFQFNTVVCHVRHVFHSRRQIVGLAFLPGNDPVIHRRAIDRISRFVEAQQRGSLGFVRHAVSSANTTAE